MGERSMLPYSKAPINGNRDIFAPLHDQIDRVFEEFTHGFSSPSQILQSGFGHGDIVPKMDLSEDDEVLTVKLDIPGVDEENIDVTLADNVLTVKGEKKSESEDKEKDYHLVERRYGRFQRSLKLPYEVLSDKVTARYDKGVLTISMPKSEQLESKARKIPIQT